MKFRGLPGGRLEETPGESQSAESQGGLEMDKLLLKPLLLLSMSEIWCGLIPSLPDLLILPPVVTFSLCFSLRSGSLHCN